LGTADRLNHSPSKSHQLRAGIAANLIYHRRLNTGISIGPGLEWVKTGRKGGQLGLFVNGGYLRNVISNTFEVKSEQVQQIKGGGTNHLFYDVGLRFGKSLTTSSEGTIEWFIKPKLQFQTPYFEQVNKYFLTEIGVNFKL